MNRFLLAFIFGFIFISFGHISNAQWQNSPQCTAYFSCLNDEQERIVRALQNTCEFNTPFTTSPLTSKNDCANAAYCFFNPTDKKHNCADLRVQKNTFQLQQASTIMLNAFQARVKQCLANDRECAFKYEYSLQKEGDECSTFFTRTPCEAGLECVGNVAGDGGICTLSTAETKPSANKPKIGAQPLPTYYAYVPKPSTEAAKPPTLQNKKTVSFLERPNSFFSWLVGVNPKPNAYTVNTTKPEEIFKDLFNSLATEAKKPCNPKTI